MGFLCEFFFSHQEVRRETIEGKGTVTRERENWKITSRTKSGGAGLGWVAKWKNGLRENPKKQDGHSAIARFQFVSSSWGELLCLCRLQSLKYLYYLKTQDRWLGGSRRKIVCRSCSL